VSKRSGAALALPGGRAPLAEGSGLAIEVEGAALERGSGPARPELVGTAAEGGGATEGAALAIVGAALADVVADAMADGTTPDCSVAEGAVRCVSAAGVRLTMTPPMPRPASSARPPAT
jgi:hypothetical protein